MADGGPASAGGRSAAQERRERGGDDAPRPARRRPAAASGLHGSSLSAARGRSGRPAFRRARPKDHRGRQQLYRCDDCGVFRGAVLAGFRLPGGKTGPARRSRAGRPARLFSLELAARPGAARRRRARRPAQRRQVARSIRPDDHRRPRLPLRRRLSRLLARFAENSGDFPGRRALPRLLSRRFAGGIGDPGDAELLRRTGALRPAEPEHRGHGLCHAQRAARHALRLSHERQSRRSFGPVPLRRRRSRSSSASPSRPPASRPRR